MEDQKQQQQNEQLLKYRKAIEYFNCKEYENASNLFKEIKEKNILPQSFDLQMNILICDFYKRNCSNHQKVLEELSSILKSLDSNKINTQSQSSQDSPALVSQPTSNGSNNSSGNFDLSQPSASSPSSSSTTPPTSTTISSSSSSSSSSTVSSTTAVATNPTPVSSGTASTSTNNLHSIQQQTQNDNSIDNDQAIVLYNQSVIYFHIKQYGSSYKILDNIYQNILSLDDYLAIRVCLLLVNVSIEAQLYDKGDSVLSFLDKSFDHFFYISTSSTSSSPSNEQYNYQHTQMSPDEFRFLIHFYKSKIYLLSNSHYLAKTEIEESIKYSLKIDYSPLLGSCHLLNANYYSIELDTDNTIKNLLLSSSNNSNTSSGSSINKPISFGNDLVIESITPRMFYNNIGSFHFNMDNKVLANYYFSRSLKESSIEFNSSGNSFSRNLDKRTEVFFNTGIILMAMGKYDLAFSCLQESCILLKCNPLVWLRLAECCIFAHVSKLKDYGRDQNSLGDDESTDDDINSKENELSDEIKDDSSKPNSISSNSGGDSSRDLNKNKSSTSTKNKNKKDRDSSNSSNSSSSSKENDGENDNKNDLEQNSNSNLDNSTSGGANNNNNTDNNSNNTDNIDNSNSNNTDNSIDDDNSNNNSVNFELVFGNIKILNNDSIMLPTVNGLHQGLQIEDSGVQSTLTNSGDEVEDSLSRLGSLSLDFANKCLRNAHYLERKILKLKKQREENQQQMQPQQPQQPPSSNQEPIEPNNLFKNYHIAMMLSILSSQAYVALCTYNPIVSLVACKQILLIFDENPSYSQIGFLYRFKYYAHIYAAEACINLNIPDQAIQFLSIDLIEHHAREVSKYDATDFNNIFYYNLSIAYILQNDLVNAEKSIYQIQQNLEQQFIVLQQLNNNNNNENNNSNNNNENSNNNQFTIQQQIINIQQQQINESFSKINLLRVYLELRKGNIDKALLLIKNERPIPIPQI